MNALLESPPPGAVPLDRRAAALAERFGGIDPSRILLDPPPGAATVDDLDAARRRTGRLYELLDGTLVEKDLSWFASLLASEVIGILRAWLIANRGPDGRRRGYIAGPDGFFRLDGVAMVTPRLRAPDVSFVARERFRDGRFPRTGYPTVAPDLVVEILSPGNTAGEMRQKRENFFAAGSRVVWQIDPLTETAETFAQGEPHRPTAVPAGGTLDAGDALPGFRLALPDLFTDDLREAGADA